MICIPLPKAANPVWAKKKTTRLPCLVTDLHMWTSLAKRAGVCYLLTPVGFTNLCRHGYENAHVECLGVDVTFLRSHVFNFCVSWLNSRWHSPGGVDSASSRKTHGDVSWVVSTPRSPIPASLHLLALQLKPSLSGLRAPQHPLFTPSLLVLIQVTRRGLKGWEFDRHRCADYAALCWTIL